MRISSTCMPLRGEEAAGRLRTYLVATRGVTAPGRWGYGVPSGAATAMRQRAEAQVERLQDVGLLLQQHVACPPPPTSATPAST